MTPPRRVLLVGGTAHGEVVKVEGDPSVVQLPAYEPQPPWSLGAAGDDVAFALQTYHLRAWYEGLAHPCIRNAVIVRRWDRVGTFGADPEPDYVRRLLQAAGLPPDSDRMHADQRGGGLPPLWVLRDPVPPWWVDSATGRWRGDTT